VLPRRGAWRGAGGTPFDCRVPYKTQVAPRDNAIFHIKKRAIIQKPKQNLNLFKPGEFQKAKRLPFLKLRINY
jgi:hypothetical protein